MSLRSRIVNNKFRECSRVRPSGLLGDAPKEVIMGETEEKKHNDNDIVELKEEYNDNDIVDIKEDK